MKGVLLYAPHPPQTMALFAGPQILDIRINTVTILTSRAKTIKCLKGCCAYDYLKNASLASESAAGTVLVDAWSVACLSASFFR